MSATAANLIERVLPPQSGLRQWVLRFYAARVAQECGLGAKSGAVTVAQRTSSDLRLNPHLHLIVLDGTGRKGR